MTKAPPIGYSPRQTHLYHQMSSALENKEKKLFSLLQSYWVHRYGLITMPMVSEFEFPFTFDDDEPFLGPPVSQLINSEREEQEKIYVEEKEVVLTDEEINQDSSSEINQEQAHLEQGFGSLNETILDKVVRGKESQFSDVSEVPRPPSPALNHLRRWLPRFSDDLPKAS